MGISPAVLSSSCIQDALLGSVPTTLRPVFFFRSVLIKIPFRANTALFLALSVTLLNQDGRCFVLDLKVFEVAFGVPPPNFSP